MSELEKISYGHKARLEGAEVLNREISEEFEQQNQSPLLQRTHFFEGRYENIYIDREKMPALEPVLEAATQFAAEITGYRVDQLRCGFWFNRMGPGDVTIPHTHDDDDELLSGVYYITVPDTSAKLSLGVGDQKALIEPEEGMMVFFSPRLIHEVTKNNSAHQRLSIGMNFGLREEFKSE